MMQEELLRILESEKKTMIFVTHSIDEAILLGDRIVIMSRRPGRIREILPVDIPRPRKILSVRSQPQLHRTKKFHLGNAQAGVRPHRIPKGIIHESAPPSASPLGLRIIRRRGNILAGGLTRYCLPIRRLSVRAFFGLVDSGELQSYMKESLLVLLYASILAVIVGVFLGVAMGRFSIVDWATDIYISALYSMPMVAMVPLIVLWFGFRVPAKVIIVFLFMVFPILLNTYQGVKDVDRNLQEVARSFCSTEGQLWRHLIIPSAIPFIVVGVRLAIGRGLVGMIVAEFYTSVTGLGYMIVRYANAFETDKLFVPIVVVMVLGVGLCGLRNGWKAESRRGETLRKASSEKEAFMKKAFLVFFTDCALVTRAVDAQTKRKVVFGVPVTPPNVVHIPPYVANDMGFFAENNIDAEFVTFEGGTQTLRGSVAGGLDITGTSSDPAIIAAARGAGTKVVGTYSHKLSQSMLVQGDIKSCKDLKGRKIGIQEVGAFNEVMSRAVMATCGLTPKDVQYIPVSTKGRVPGLLSNQIDTAILHVDQALVAKKKKNDLNILVNLWEPLPKWLYAAYIAPEKEIGSNRQLYVDIMAALIKANRFIYNNKAKTVEIATKYTQQPSDVVSETYDILANAGAWPVNDGLPKDMVEWTINKQVELGTIKAEEKPSYEKLIDLSVIQAALSKAGGRLTGDKRWD